MFKEFQKGSEVTFEPRQEAPAAASISRATAAAKSGAPKATGSVSNGDLSNGLCSC